MGFLDNIKKLLSGGMNTDNTENNSVYSDAAPLSDDKKSISDELLKSAELTPKPYFMVESEYGPKRFFFELSRDFIEFNSHSEADPSYQYEPWSDEEFTGYNDDLPVMFICPDDDIYDASESFEKGEPVDELNITECELSCFLYSTSFEKYGKLFYAYAFASDTARETEMFCVQYDPRLAGTALEKKLKAALDHAVQSYREENIEGYTD